MKGIQAGLHIQPLLRIEREGNGGVRARGGAPRRRAKAEYRIQSVDRAFDLLEAFNSGEGVLGVTDLAHRLGLSKNRTFRLLATLECRGYIEQDKRTGNYRLGLKTFELASVFLHHLGLRRQAQPILEELVATCDETAYLAVLDGPEIVYLLMQETTQTVRITPRVGYRLPAYCTAAGKIQLAYESLGHLTEIFRGYPLRKLTVNTIADLEALRAHLQAMAKQGYALDNEECEEGVRCVAAPVRDYAHRVVAVGLLGPASRFTLERIEEELAPLVMVAGAKTSQRLGCTVGRRDEGSHN